MGDGYEEATYCVASRDRTRSNSLRLQKGPFRLEIRKNSLTMGLVKGWSRLPTVVVEVHTLRLFKTRLKEHMDEMIKSGIILP